jgi:protein-S-isoprenylcysteine O-methyltransferase Ste14
METENKIQTKNRYKNKLHRVLAHSYVVYLILLLVGVCLDFIFRIKIFSDSVAMPAGFFFLVLASGLIIWAQKTGNDLRKIAKETKDVKAEHFCRGPYCYTRIPTQWGLFFLMLGFGIVTNAFFVILSTVVSLLISKFIFIEKHDKILTAKYGEAYREYKELVKF